MPPQPMPHAGSAPEAEAEDVDQHEQRETDLQVVPVQADLRLSRFHQVSMTAVPSSRRVARMTKMPSGRKALPHKAQTVAVGTGVATPSGLTRTAG